MLTNQNNYDELIYKKHPKYTYIWLSFIITLFICLITVSCFYKFNKFYETIGLVIKKGNDNYVQILLENDKLDIIKNDNLILEKEKIDFQAEISTYIYSDNGKAYREVKLFFQNNYADGEIMNLTFKSPETTLMKELQEKLKKGMK